jgi:hypothetical protein
MAVAMGRAGYCASCRLELDPAAAMCWFCSTPNPGRSLEAQFAGGSAVAGDESVAFARGVLLGAALVLVPFVVHLTAL